MYHLKVFNNLDEIESPTGENVKNFQIDKAPELYALSGAAQCAPAKNLVAESSYHYGKPLGFPVSKIEAFEVDTPGGLELARRMFKIL